MVIFYLDCLCVGSPWNIFREEGFVEFFSYYIPCIYGDLVVIRDASTDTGQVGLGIGSWPTNRTNSR